MVNDISRVFFHSPAKRRVYVQLPEEDKEGNQEQLCGRLNFSTHGTRDAAQNWFDAYSQQLIDIGFQQGVASFRAFYHPQRPIMIYVHGDDYVSTGQPHNLQWLKNKLETKYQVKTQILWPNKDQLQQVKILNRVIIWDNENGIGYEVDPRHVEIIIQQFSLDNAKPVVTFGTKEDGKTTVDAEDPLDEGPATKYRALVARCNYLCFDRPDIALAVKELARNMSAPRNGDWVRFKRLGRYLIGRRRLQQWFEWQDAPTAVHIYTDADFGRLPRDAQINHWGRHLNGKH